MESKKLIWIFMTVGGYVGGWIPTLWDPNPFSFASILLAAVGGLAGIWLGFKLGE